MLARKILPAVPRINPSLSLCLVKPHGGYQGLDVHSCFGDNFFLLLGSQLCSPLNDNCNHSWLFLSCLMCCEGSQDLYVCPGTTKPLQKLFCFRCVRLLGEWSLLGWDCCVESQGGRQCSTTGAGAECNHFVLRVLKNFWGVKGFCYILMGVCVLREVPPVSAVVLALSGLGGFEGEAAMGLYLVCWRSDRAPRGTWSRLGQSEKRKHRPSNVIFTRQMKCFGPTRGQRNLWAVVFLLDQWLSSCGLLTPGSCGLL